MVRKLVVNGVAVTSLVLGGAAVLAPSATAVEMSVRVVAVIGAGCPAGTVGTTAVGGTTIELTHSSFMAEFGPGIPQDRSWSGCWVTMKVTGPTGSEFAVLQVYRYGSLRLPTGATATDQARAHFSGKYADYTFLRLTGPVNTDWSRVHPVPASSRAWSGCDGTNPNLILDSGVEVQRGSGNASVLTTGFMSIQRQKVVLTWRNC